MPTWLRSGSTRSRWRAEGLDVAEDVVPAAAVEADDAAAQRVQDLVHLEDRRQRLDQHRDLHRARSAGPRRASMKASTSSHSAASSIALQLGQVEVRAASLRAAARRRCGRRTGPGRTALPLMRVPSTSTCFSSRCQPRGRTISTVVAVRVAARSACRRPAPCSRACRRRPCAGSAGPSSRLSQVGRSSPRSRPCSTLAPELSALMTIFGSTGPVISTRRSRSAAGQFGATRQSPSRMAAVSARKSGSSPASKRAWRCAAGARAGRWRVGLEAPVQLGQEVQGAPGSAGRPAPATGPSRAGGSVAAVRRRLGGCS